MSNEQILTAHFGNTTPNGLNKQREQPIENILSNNNSNEILQLLKVEEGESSRYGQVRAFQEENDDADVEDD